MVFCLSRAFLLSVLVGLFTSSVFASLPTKTIAQHENVENLKQIFASKTIKTRLIQQKVLGYLPCRTIIQLVKQDTSIAEHMAVTSLVPCIEEIRFILRNLADYADMILKKLSPFSPPPLHELPSTQVMENHIDEVTLRLKLIFKTIYAVHANKKQPTAIDLRILDEDARARTGLAMYIKGLVCRYGRSFPDRDWETIKYVIDSLTHMSPMQCKHMKEVRKQVVEADPFDLNSYDLYFAADELLPLAPCQN